MNWKLGQLTPTNSLRPPDGDSAPPASVPHAFPGGSAEQALFRFDLRRSLEMHRRLAVGFAVAGLILGAAYLIRFWSVYSAQSLVYIQPTPSVVLEQAQMHWPYNYDPATYDSYIQQQLLSMTRADVLVGALHKLQPGVWRQSGESDQNAAERLKGAVEAARVGTSYQVSITAHASNPETAAALANAVAASYIDDTSHEQKAGDAERLAMLKEERDRVKKELDDDHAEQVALNAQLGVAAIGPVAPEHYDDDIAKIHEDLVKARTDHDEAAARLTAMDTKNGLNSSALNSEADKLLDTDPGMGSLKSALLSRRAALVSQMANLTPSHPQYKQDQAELEKIDASLDSATQDMRGKASARIEEQLHADLDRTSGMEARLNGELAQATRAAAGATPKLQRASDLANDITRLQNRFSIVDEQLQNQILEDNAPGTAHLVVAAVAPQHPAVAGVIRNAMVLFLGFVFLGLAAAVIAQKMDPKVYVASDVEQLLGFAPMAQLPDFAEVSDEVADEHLLRLAAGIEYASKEGGMRNCIFTGAAPEAGATTVATRVRDMLEVMGRRTTLIVNAPGTAAPSASLDTRDSLAHEQAHPAARSTALLQQVVEETESGDKSLVLTDAAPLLVSAETEYLVRFADCTIVVVESGVTTRAQVRAAASRLQRLNVAAVGFVLNRVRLAKADPAFRHSVEEVERHLRTQSRFAARQPLGSRLVTAETVSASAELAATAESAATPARPALTAATVALTDAPEQTTAARPAPIAQPELVVVRPEPALPQARLEPEPAFTPSAPTWQELEPIVTAAPVLPLVLKEFEPIVSATPVSPQMWRQPEPMATPPVLPPARKDLEPMVARTPVSPQMWRQSEPMATPPILPPARNDLEPMAAAQPAPVLPPVQPELQPVATQSALASPRPDPQPAVAALPSDIPWWLTEAPARDTALERLGNARTLRTRVGSWETELAGEGGTKATVAVAVEEKAQASPSRLSGLRGLFFALGFKELKEAGQPAPEASGAAAAPAPQPEPAVPVQAAAVHAPVEPTVTAQAPMETAVPVPTAAPIPEPEPAFAAADGDPLRNYSPRRVTAEPEFLPPKLEKPTRRDRRDTFDDVQILPSWRGQYKKKD